MNNLITHNLGLFKTKEVPELSIAEFQAECLEILSNGSRMIGLFPVEENASSKKILAVFANDDTSAVHLTSTVFDLENDSFESFANEFPLTNYFECELAEDHHIRPLNHPWLRPVRKQDYILDNVPYKFYNLEGDEIHEVAVGPVHAGVIEPGHFRFQCNGENVFHLEISLGYQHRGIESILLRSNYFKRLNLVESIAGDTVIGHTLAYCQAIETLSKTSISLRESMIRVVAEELERIAMHLSGLGGVANDVGFAIGAASYGRLRTLVINSMALLCGSRFGRGLLKPGGLRFDLTEEVLKKITVNLLQVSEDIKLINDFMFSSTSVMSRLEDTGKVHNLWAKQIGLVGPAARASAVHIDTRTNFPYGAYRYHVIQTVSLDSGDVFARAKIRSFEIDESLRFILDLFNEMPEENLSSQMQTKNNFTNLSLEPGAGVISLTEGWRGEIVHCLFTDTKGNLMTYKIKDPSFNNWYGLALSVRNEGISNFPLCNKSFDLSYSGHDL
ncbi:MAG: hydrogenase [Bacteroidota bacterium]|nr:hydrogenase [Bacteroidota bacterium]MDP4189982.1 hydrogenase [Bacteroidota bacterium]MDP4193414.1 hydrogenase [Bacteroidota bacterium]